MSERPEFNAAYEMLAGGIGTREEREAALRIVSDYYFGLGCT